MRTTAPPSPPATDRDAASRDDHSTNSTYGTLVFIAIVIVAAVAAGLVFQHG